MYNLVCFDRNQQEAAAAILDNYVSQVNIWQRLPLLQSRLFNFTEILFTFSTIFNLD